MSKDYLSMIEGWAYAVTVGKDKMEGRFKGYAMIGSESALVIRLSDGVTRFIPIASIKFIDLLRSCVEEKEEEKKSEQAYYG